MGKSRLTALSVKFAVERGEVPCLLTSNQQATINNLSRHLPRGTLFELSGTMGLRVHASRRQSA
jgi:hypothetical protein